MAAAAPPVTALRWDWNITTLTNDTGTGTENWVDQDLTDGQVNDLLIDWDYTPATPSLTAALIVGDWLVGHPRSFEGLGLFFGDFVTPVGIKDVQATMQCRVLSSGLPAAGFDCNFTLFAIECFDEQDAKLIVNLTDAGVCTAYVDLGSPQGIPVSIPTDSIVDIGMKFEENGLNTDFTVYVNGVAEDTFSVLTADFGTGVRQQIEGRARIGMKDNSGDWHEDVVINIFRYQLATL